MWISVSVGLDWWSNAPVRAAIYVCYWKWQNVYLWIHFCVFTWTAQFLNATTPETVFGSDRVIQALTSTAVYLSLLRWKHGCDLRDTYPCPNLSWTLLVKGAPCFPSILLKNSHSGPPQSFWISNQIVPEIITDNTFWTGQVVTRQRTI